jgi:hypothetical protein
MPRDGQQRVAFGRGHAGDCREALRTMPSRDQSVQEMRRDQCPPYWGLRDYKLPPSIWGGDPDCKHRFAKKAIVRELRRGTGLQTSPHSVRGGGKKGAAIRTITIERGFCRCGAWRGCFGLEPTYQLYVEHMVEVFDEVWRVLRDDGVLWLNMGDCYANSRAGWSAQRYMDENRDDRTFRDKPFNTFTRGMGSKHERTGKVQKPGGTSPSNNGFRSIDWAYRSNALAGGAGEKGRKGSNRAQRGDGNEGIAYGPMEQPNRQPQVGLKQKDKAGMPWRVAFALQDAGWYLRQDVVWHKKNPMPESTGDRPTTAHEFMFLFSKSGDTLCWRHADGRWVYEKPEPDWRWRHRVTRDVVAIDPQDPKTWFRFNLWRGYDYYYDAYAIMEPSSPDSHARAARARSKTHKHAGAGPGLDGKAHAIAIGSPVAGRVLPVPFGWDVEGEGHHGSVHRDGRRQEVRPQWQADEGCPADRLEWKGGGPNSRFNKDRVPRERKADAHAGTYADQDGPRPKNNANFDAHLGSADLVEFRNKRSVWSIATHPFKEAHFATFPPKLIEPCILAGCAEAALCSTRSAAPAPRASSPSYTGAKPS